MRFWLMQVIQGPKKRTKQRPGVPYLLNLSPKNAIYKHTYLLSIRNEVVNLLNQNRDTYSAVQQCETP